jgi:hypothetical protein
MAQGLYSTGNMGLAAYLLSEGIFWVKTERRDSHTTFFYERSLELDQLVETFLGTDGRDVRNLLRSYRKVRAAAGI